jgi:LPPG:FO 2-phospho-L-lactate transferase
MTVSILALAGGIGGAKLALGLTRVLSPQQLTIVVNTGDDETFHGLHVSPDLDTMMYTLSGLVNLETGWGLVGDQFNAMDMLGLYGSPTWFNLGDKDLGTHIRRTELLRNGWTLSQITADLSHRIGVRHRVAPMSDQTVKTMLETDEGNLPFQIYFVERRCEPIARRVLFESTGPAKPSPSFEEALESASALIFCPSNPFLSIGPILALDGVRQTIENFAGPRIVVSPIVDGLALRGPAAKLMGEMGHDVSCVGVAHWYQGLCDIFLIDEVDRHHATEITLLGMRVEVARTVMATEADKIGLARRVIEMVES